VGSDLEIAGPAAQALFPFTCLLAIGLQRVAWSCQQSGLASRWWWTGFLAAMVDVGAGCRSHCVFVLRAGARPLSIARRSPPPTESIQCRSPFQSTGGELFSIVTGTPPRRLHWWAALALMEIAGDQFVGPAAGENSPAAGPRKAIQAVGAGAGQGGREEIPLAQALLA